MKSSLMLAALVAAVLASAISVVYVKHQSRQLFAKSQELTREADRLNVEWNMLQLEQAAWSAHGRIERVARERLQMRMPRRDEVMILKR
jgi:cell division protein FtsL